MQPNNLPNKNVLNNNVPSNNPNNTNEYKPGIKKYFGRILKTVGILGALTIMSNLSVTLFTPKEEERDSCIKVVGLDECQTTVPRVYVDPYVPPVVGTEWVVTGMRDEGRWGMTPIGHYKYYKPCETGDGELLTLHEKVLVPIDLLKTLDLSDEFFGKHEGYYMGEYLTPEGNTSQLEELSSAMEDRIRKLKDTLGNCTSPDEISKKFVTRDVCGLEGNPPIDLSLGNPDKTGEIQERKIEECISQYSEPFNFFKQKAVDAVEKGHILAAYVILVALCEIAMRMKMHLCENEGEAHSIKENPFVEPIIALFNCIKEQLGNNHKAPEEGQDTANEPGKPVPNLIKAGLWNETPGTGNAKVDTTVKVGTTVEEVVGGPEMV